MSTGRLIPPDLDDRTWQDIVDEAKSLISKYTPGWTDHNPSDLGITLVELFAWIAEGMIYRLNQVPEKNFVEFLNLIGITRDPATPAHADLTFTVTGAGPVLIPAGTQVSTPQTESEEGIIFETDEDLNALPINLTRCLFVKKGVNPFPYKNVTKNLVSGPLQGTELAIPAYSASTLLLGFDLKTTQPIHINFGFKEGAAEGSAGLLAAYFSPGLTFVPIAEDKTDSFQKDGELVFQIPANWQSLTPANLGINIAPSSPEDEVTDSLFWLWIFIRNYTSSEMELVFQGISINSVSTTNALTVNPQQTNAQAELLGVSNGKPFQFFALKNAPLYKRPGSKDSYTHLTIQVREPVGGAFGPWEEWKRVDDIPKGDGKLYRCNPITGDIMFGNYDPATGKGNGKIPPQNSEIRALTYRYVVGGTKGNVPALKINVLRSSVSGVISVNNPGAATGGSDQEPVEETKRRGPEVLKNRFRTVTIEDYEYLAREATTDIKKVRALPPQLHPQGVPSPYTPGEPWLFGGIDRSPGRVNVIIVPDAPEPNGHPSPEPRPKPDENLLMEVSDFLNQRRPAAVHLLVTGPRYLPIRVIATIKVWQSAIDGGLIEDPISSTSFRDSVVNKLKRFLHPTRGNHNGLGWEIGERIYVNQVFTAIQPLSEIGFIESIKLQAAPPAYTPPDRPPGYGLYIQGTWIWVVDYEMVCYGGTPSDITVSKT
jgi:hypothetical protein